MMRWAWLWVLGALVSCSDGTALSSPLRRAESGVVVIKALTPMSLLAFRHEDDLRWKIFPSSRATEVEVDVHGPYRVLFVCEEPQGGTTFTIVGEAARTLDDERMVELLCSLPLPTHRVFGTLTDVNARLVLQFQEGFGLEPDGFFEMVVQEGVRDLLMFPHFESTAIAIRRDLEIFDDLDLGAIDVPAENPVPLERRSFTATNPASTETLSASSDLSVGGTSAFLGSGQGLKNIPLAPREILRPSDRQVIEFVAFRPDGPGNPRQRQVRTVRRESSEAPSEIVFPEGMEDVVFERPTTGITATWSSIPFGSHLVLLRSTASGSGSVFLFVDASRAFMDATDPTRLVLDLSDVPGFKPEWYPRPDSSFDTWKLNAWLGSDSVEVAESRSSTAADARALSAPLPLAHEMPPLLSSAGRRAQLRARISSSIGER